jgi:methionyl-tRNA formyltransferase
MFPMPYMPGEGVSSVRVLFMGTPEFAVPSLAALCDHCPPGRLWAGGLDLVGVLTREDKPAGRGRQVAHSPVKQFALEQKIRVYQPGSLRKPESQALLRHLAPNLIVVAAFGQILPPDVLRMPNHGCLNVHASLLPRWRGASPINAAILAGDGETGVTLMRMDEGLDTGPMVAKATTPIGSEETAGKLSDRLAKIGAQLLIDVLPLWLAKGIVPEPQDNALATTTRLLRKEDGRLNWSLPAEQLARAVRAFTPWPGAYTAWNGQQLKVLRARALDANGGRQPGECFALGEGRHTTLACACGQGALVLEMVQLQGKRAATGEDLLRGHPALASAALGA